MRDRLEKTHHLLDIPRTRSTGANINTGSFELLDRVPSKAEVGAATIVVIEKRALVRECFTRCLNAESGHKVVSFPNVDSWLEVCDAMTASLILLSTAGKSNDLETHEEISRLSQQGTQLPMILLSDVEDPNQIIDAIGRGARGYVPTSVSLEVVVEVLRLVRAGGVFIPASSLIATKRSNDCTNASRRSGNGLFTERQAAVVEALRRGKANKIIAYELNMRESTVKVHVRNIMKKLKARNRTEVAFMTHELMQSKGAAESCRPGRG